MGEWEPGGEIEGGDNSRAMECEGQLNRMWEADFGFDVPSRPPANDAVHPRVIPEESPPMNTFKLFCSAARVLTRRWGVGIALGILATAAIVSSGCARPSTSRWAQTSPIMVATTTTNATVSLGVRD